MTEGWIPTFVGMTEGEVGMTEGEVGMTEGESFFKFLLQLEKKWGKIGS